MTAERPYTDADVRLVTAAIAGDGVAGDLKYRSLARDLVAGAVLDALTAAGWTRGHCPGCDCPDVPYDGAPPTHRLVIAPEGGEQ